MNTSQGKKELYSLIVLSVFAVTSILVSGCSAKIDSIRDASEFFPPVPGPGTEPIADCLPLAGQYEVNGQAYTIEQANCSQVRIVTDCLLPDNYCKGMGYPKHSELQVIADGQDHDGVRSYYETNNGIRSLVVESGADKTVRYFKGTNPCNHPEGGEDHVFGVKTTDGGLTQCVSGPARSFAVGT